MSRQHATLILFVFSITACLFLLGWTQLDRSPPPSHQLDQQLASSDSLTEPAAADNQQQEPSPPPPRRRRRISFDDFRDRVNCTDFASNGSLPLFDDVTHLFSGNHFCVLKSVLVDGDVQWRPNGAIRGGLKMYIDRRNSTSSRNIFLAPRRREFKRFPHSLFGSRVTLVVSEDRNEEERKVASRGTRRVASAVFLPLSYTFDHPTHALENLGLLFKALQQHQHRHSIDTIILPQRVTPKPGSLQHRALACAVAGADWARVKIVGVQDSLLVESLLVPSANYELFPDNVTARGFMELFHSNCLDVLKGGGADDEKKKKLVFLKRSSRSSRNILDFDVFLGMLKSAIRKVDASLTVDVVDPSDHLHDVDELARRMRGAELVVGIHGAALTNLMLVPPSSSSSSLRSAVTVVTELFPFLFFEPRFRLLAQRVGFHYLPWNCGSLSCAGDAEAAKQLLKKCGVEFSERSGDLFRYHSDKIVRWPSKGYVGDVCFFGFEAIEAERIIGGGSSGFSIFCLTCSFCAARSLAAAAAAFLFAAAAAAVVFGNRAQRPSSAAACACRDCIAAREKSSAPELSIIRSACIAHSASASRSDLAKPTASATRCG